MAGSCEHGNEFFYFIKALLSWLSQRHLGFVRTGKFSCGTVSCIDRAHSLI
jgi:hypothetical protein